MTVERGRDIESPEDLEERRSDEPVREEQGDAVLAELLDQPVELRRDIESLEDLEERRSDELVLEEQGDAVLAELIDGFGEPKQGPAPGSGEIMEGEFACRACRLIFSRSCLVDDSSSFCRDCAALAAAARLPTGEVPQVDRVQHPCPACGAPVMVPEREDVSCGFVCPSCRGHLSLLGGRLHFFWNHREA